MSRRAAAGTIALLFAVSLFTTPVHVIVEPHDVAHEHHEHDDSDHTELDHASPDVVLGTSPCTPDSDFEISEGGDGAAVELLACRVTAVVESPPPRAPLAAPACPRAPPAA